MDCAPKKRKFGTSFEISKRAKSTYKEENVEHSMTLNRSNKNRPKEISSKIFTKPFIMKYESPKNSSKERVDPRFSNKYGEYQPKAFETNYKFLTKIRKKEKKVLNKLLIDEELVPEEREKIKSHLKRQGDRLYEMKRKKVNEKINKEKIDYEIAQLKRGKKPFYQKKSVEKLLNLAQQFEELKQNGKLNKHMKRRFKKNKKCDIKTILHH